MYSTIRLELIFPHFMLKPFHIRGIISHKHGVAIEVIKPSNEITIEVIEVNKDVEEIVLPRLSSSNKPVFPVEESFIVMENLNIISAYKRLENME